MNPLDGVCQFASESKISYDRLPAEVEAAKDVVAQWMWKHNYAVMETNGKNAIFYEYGVGISNDVIRPACVGGSSGRMSSPTVDAFDLEKLVFGIAN